MSGLRIFQNREFGAVRVIEYGGEPWFVARDVCAVLGTETRDLPDILEHDEQRPIVDIIHTLNDSTGLRRDSRIISEPGLYSLVLRSRKPEAKAFKRWIVHEVIPSIRRTGGYGALALPNFRNPAEAARAWADKEEQRLLEEQKRLALEQKMEEVRRSSPSPSRSPRPASSWGKWRSSSSRPRATTLGRTAFSSGSGTGATCTRMVPRPTCLPREAWMPDGWRSRRAPASEAVGKVTSPARRKSRARGKSTSSTCSRKWWSHDHPLPPPHSVARGRGIPYGGRAQGSRSAVSAPAALQETRLELAVSDGLREVCRQT